MAKQIKKVNRQKAKLDFLKHESKTVRWRWQDYKKNVQHTYTLDRVARAAKGRAVEKARLLDLATDVAQKDVIDKTIKEVAALYKPTQEELSEMHKDLMDAMRYAMITIKKRSKKKEILNFKEIKAYREMLKAEKLEPTKVNKLDAEGIQSWPAVIVVAAEIKDLLWS